MSAASLPARRAAWAFRLGVLPATAAVTRLWTLGRGGTWGYLRRHAIVLRANVPYRPSGPYPTVGRRACRLDLYRPAGRGPWPVVLYAHGGGFSMLTKETYWAVAAAWARRGYLVAVFDYRKAPAHPFPAALTDACAALHWLHHHAETHGGDATRLVLAGDSAGANLVTALALALAAPRPEPFARPLFALGRAPPRAVVAACGLLQVSDPGRFKRAQPRLSRWVDARIRQVCAMYGGDGGLASPLLELEAAAGTLGPLPPFFVPVGDRDPLLEDSRRLCAALGRLGESARLAVYPGAGHAFHVLPRGAQGRRCWADIFAFVDRLVSGSFHVPAR